MTLIKHKSCDGLGCEKCYYKGYINVSKTVTRLRHTGEVALIISSKRLPFGLDVNNKSCGVESYDSRI